MFFIKSSAGNIITYDIYNEIKKPPSVATFNTVQFFVSRSWSGPVGYLIRLLKHLKTFLTKNVFGRRAYNDAIIIIINNINDGSLSIIQHNKKKNNHNHYRPKKRILRLTWYNWYIIRTFYTAVYMVPLHTERSPDKRYRIYNNNNNNTRQYNVTSCSRRPHASRNNLSTHRLVV